MIDITDETQGTPIDPIVPPQGITLPTIHIRHARPVVNSFHLSELIEAYNFCFAEYSKSRKMSQLIPALVWRDVYLLFKSSFRASSFSEDTLKERLRETLRELKTGNSNVENSETTVLQDEDVLTTLRATGGHVGQNVLKM